MKIETYLKKLAKIQSASVACSHACANCGLFFDSNLTEKKGCFINRFIQLLEELEPHETANMMKVEKELKKDAEAKECLNLITSFNQNPKEIKNPDPIQVKKLCDVKLPDRNEKNARQRN